MRKDYFRDRWTIVKRSGLQSNREKTVEGAGFNDCLYCPGKENLTAKEIRRYPNTDTWQIRVFPSERFLDNEEAEKDKSWRKNSLKVKHETIVATPNHFQKVSQLTINDLKILLLVFKEQSETLAKDMEINYATIIKDQGPEVGISSAHSSFDLIGTSKIPPFVQEKINHSYHADCAYCDIVEKEEAGGRVVFENHQFLAFCPFAPRTTHELWIVSKKHLRGFEDFDEKSLVALADVLKKALGAVERVVEDYSLVFNFGINDQDFHFHIEILPQFEAPRSGFELGTELSVIFKSPEESAEIYKGEL